jgi:hypothetical protein
MQPAQEQNSETELFLVGVIVMDQSIYIYI